jgi:hypothetical protein
MTVSRLVGRIIATSGSSLSQEDSNEIIVKKIKMDLYI